MKCLKCGEDTNSDRAFEIAGSWYCVPCFYEKAGERKDLSREEWARVKGEVKRELASVLPREPLANLIEHCHDQLLEPDGKFDEVIGRTVNLIERMVGMAMCKEVLVILKGLSEAIEEQKNVLDQIGHFIDDQKNDIREKLRKLESL